MRLNGLLLTAVAGLVPSLSAAQDAIIELDTIEVTADPETGDVPGVDVIGADRIETEYQGAGLITILRETPGVAIQGGGGNGAETAVNIRGQQDFGRVAVTIDGMRQNFAGSGHGANGTFLIDTEMIRQIEVIRGPGAKAGAPAGAVEFRRLRADDLLDGDAATGSEFRLRYGADTSSPTVHGAFAAQASDAVDFLFALTRSEEDDYTAPDGTDVNAWQLTQSGLAILGVNTQGGGRFTFSADRMNEQYPTGLGTGFDRRNELVTGSYLFGYQSDHVAGGWVLDARVNDYWTELRQERITGVPSRRR